MSKDSHQAGGGLPQIGITRLPSFIKNGMVTASTNHAIRARLNITTRQLAKVNAVKLNQQFDDAKNKSRPLNERLSCKIHPVLLPDRVSQSPESGPERSLESTEKLPLIPRFRPAYDPDRVGRSKSFYWPKSNPLTNPYESEMGMSSDAVTKPRPPTLPSVRFSINEGPVFQTGAQADWPSRWFSVKTDNPVSPRRQKTLGKIRIWKPTLDSILKSEAMKQNMIEKAKTSLFLKENKAREKNDQ